MSRKDSDEFYVLDLCDELLGVQASRQHRFEWLRGDFSEKLGTHSYLPVDGYWESHQLVVEFAERQHAEPVKHFDKPDVLTISGVHRGLQRAIYDARRVEQVPQHGIRFVVIPAAAFALKKKRIVRDRARDIQIVEALLREESPPSPVVGLPEPE